MTLPWQTPHFPTTISARIQEATGTRYLFTCFLPIWLCRRCQRWCSAVHMELVPLKKHLPPMVGDRAPQIQIHPFHAFRAGSEQLQQEKTSSICEKVPSQSFPHYASNVPHVTHSQEGHLPGSKQLHGFLHTEARREPLLTSRTQTTDSPNFIPI